MIVWCDRDGTLSHEITGKYVHTADELRLLSGAAQGIALLQDAGLIFCVVTNQQGIAKGEIVLSEYLGIHRKMIDAVVEEGGRPFRCFTCPHLESDNCDCRKPMPGLLFYSAGFYRQPLGGAWMIGDHWTDIVAAKKCSKGTRTILVETGRGRDTQNWAHFNDVGIQPDYVEPNMLAASERILGVLRHEGYDFDLSVVMDLLEKEQGGAS